MNRRQFLKTSGITLAGAAAVPFQDQYRRASSPGRPNILYIMTDQQFAGAMSCAGNPYLRTPNMDALAAMGTRFEKNYCTQPLCIPSRTSMFTGRMPHETGITHNHRALDDRLWHMPNMGRIFTDAGYECGYIGKWHIAIPPDQPAVHGFSTVRCLVSARSREKDHDIPGECRQFLHRDRRQPFLLVASFFNPHDACEWARGEPLPMGSIPPVPPPGECPPLPENFEIPAGEPDILRRLQQEAPRVYPTTKWTPGKWRQYRWAYYRLVEKVDTQIGRLLRILRETGLEDNTLIIFSADHGDGHSAHRWNQKQVLYEEAARVPLIVSWRGVTKPGHVDGTHLTASGLDLIPTMCDYAGIRPPKSLRGYSLRASAEGRYPSAWRDCVVTETEFCNFGKSQGVTGRMLRTGRYKYIVYSNGLPREQLFDMEHDPGEMVSLGALPEYKTVLRNHRARLAAWCRQTGDRFPVPSA